MSPKLLVETTPIQQLDTPRKIHKEQPFDNGVALAGAELKAEAGHLGLLLDENPVPSWVCRHSKTKLVFLSAVRGPDIKPTYARAFKFT